MSRQVLSSNQKKLLPLVKKFKDDFYLVGGTALALQIKHRRSIDFDLFTQNELKPNQIAKTILNQKLSNQHYVNNKQEQTFLFFDDVKFTFYSYPFKIPHLIKFKDIITMPTILDIAAMKAYAIGQRAKWKDYVDLYYIFKYHHSFNEVSKRTQQLFPGFYNEKLLCEQLAYFKDIDYTEKVEWLKNQVSTKTIQKHLANIALQLFDK